MDVSAPSAIRKTVVIASSQRSGSSLLGRYLHATGRCGVPLEYLNQGNWKNWHKRFGTKNLFDFLDAVEPLRTSSNGVFALKCHYFQLQAVGSIAAILSRYRHVSFVRIERRDLLRQAISRTISMQTGVWISGQEEQRPPVYDRDQIARNIRILNRQKSQWSTAFAITGVPCRDVYFEDLISNAASVVTQIAEYCGIESEDLCIPERPPLRGQQRSVTTEWVDRFRDETTEQNELLIDARQSIKDSLYDVARHVRAAFRLNRSAVGWPQSPNLYRE